LHGIRSNPDSIIITQVGYVALLGPNQYRQQKLPLKIRESVTLLIGYNMGEFNVLTAVDWSKYVFTDQNATYPQDLILFLVCDTPRSRPYRDHTGTLAIEFSDLSELLRSIKKIIDKKVRQNKTELKDSKDISDRLADLREKDIKKFVDDQTFKQTLLEELPDGYLVNAFLDYFSRSIDLTWDRSRPPRAFDA
jgi:hypothetical protein